MPIQVGDNFDHKSKKPLDNRTQYATLAAMKAVSDADIPEGLKAYCVATDKEYKFLSSNTVDTNTGKWRECEAGDSGVELTQSEYNALSQDEKMNGKTYYITDASGGGGGGGASALSELTDTTISSPSNNQVLTYDSTTSKWKNADAQAGSSSLSGLTDVTITSATSGQVLKNDGTKWVNGTVPSDDTKQPKTLETPLTIDGTTVTSVEPALSALASGKQAKALATPIVIAGATYTTVESALAALNTSSGDSYAHQFSGGSTVSDFEADIKAHYYNATSHEVYYGDFIINYITSSGGVTFTNNCPDGNSKIENYEWVIYCNCGNPDGYQNGNLINIVCFSCDSTTRNCTVYNKKMGVTASSGSWNENYWYTLEGGGGDTSKCYSTDDTAETAIADADYFPFQDVSANVKRKTLWSNVKSVLKTYFDTLYSGIFTNATELAKIGEQNGVPTYDGQIISLPTVHNFDKANLYSTTEQVVGKWTDGRPLYQRRLSFTGVSVAGGNWGTATNALSGMNVDLIVNTFIEQTGGQYWYPSSGGKDGTANLTFLNPRTSNSTTFVGAVIQYTKTTDAANSFNYASENDYSTSETIVGTWVNGEMLYQRTFTGTFPATLSTSVQTDIAITNNFSYKIVDIKGAAQWKEGSNTSNAASLGAAYNITTASTYINFSHLIWCLGVFKDGTTLKLRILGSYVTAFQSQPYYVTIQYTKS